MDLGGQVGAKLGLKIDHKSVQKMHQKNDAKKKASWRHPGRILGPFLQKNFQGPRGSADTRGAVLPPVTGQKQEFSPEHALGSPPPGGAGGLPTPAAITAGPLFFWLAFSESEFKKAGLFGKYI